MKKILLLFLILLPTLAIAQSSVSTATQKYARLDTQDTIDRHVLMDILYEDIQIDTVLKKQFLGTQVLQVGTTTTMYQRCSNLSSDSLCWASKNKVTWERFDSLSRTTPYGYRFYVSHVLNSEKCLEQRSIFLTRYQALDTAVVWNWTLHPDTMRVCGHLCHKATATFRGRTWTAWWTEDLPYSAGPWKLCGLPGVILRASDSKGMHLIEATTIRKPSLPFIVRLNSQFNTVSLKEYHRIVADYHLNPRVYSAALGITAAPGSKLVERLFYAPYEDVE